MTDTPMTPDREQEIRALDLLELMSDRVAPVISGHLAALLAEVDRLRARVAELEGAAGTARAMHRKHPDSEHCQYDDMTWPCPTETALDDQASPAARPTGFPMLTGRARHDARVVVEAARRANRKEN